MPAVSWRGHSPFRVCGVTGLVAACVVALGLSAARGYSLWLETLVIACAVATFCGLALATKVVGGREQLIYYHHEIAVLAVTAGVVGVAGGPVLGHLDVTALGLGAFLVCGRVGCLTVGCCHGRPASHGIVYGPAHTPVAGYLVGVRLVPVQAFEAAGVCALVIVGAVSGAGVGLYVSGYAVLRFGLERLRGDAGRRVWRGVSEAQWTSVAVAGAAAVFLGGAHVMVAGALLVAALLIAGGALPARRGLLDPPHVHELARAVAAESGTTSLGVLVSHGRAAGREHYTFSGVRDRGSALGVGRAIGWLAWRGGSAELVPGPAGVFHLLRR
jgi:prolipoprotein diacylglyceryltransferase